MSETKTEWAVSSEQYSRAMLGHWFRIEFVKPDRKVAQRRADQMNTTPGPTGRNAYVVKREVTEWVRA